MLGFLQKGIKNHRALFGACVLASFILYTVTIIILMYYCSLILETEDRARYCYYEASFPQAISFGELSRVEASLQQEFAGVLEAVSYTDVLDGFMPVLIVHSGGEAAVCGLDKDLGDGAIVQPDMADAFALQYPGIQYQKETEVMAYGSQPDFFAAIISYDAVTDYVTGSEKMMLRTKRPLKHRERKRLIRLLSEHISQCRLQYTNRMAWVMNGIRYTLFYVIFGICIYIYTMICNMLLLYQMIKQQKKELSVYLICGAPKGFIRNYLSLEILFTQMIAAVLSCIFAYFSMPLISAIQVSHQYALPYISVLFSGAVSMIVAVFVSEQYQRKYA